MIEGELTYVEGRMLERQLDKRSWNAVADSGHELHILKRLSPFGQLYLDMTTRLFGITSTIVLTVASMHRLFGTTQCRRMFLIFLMAQIVVISIFTANKVFTQYQMLGHCRVTSSECKDAANTYVSVDVGDPILNFLPSLSWILQLVLRCAVLLILR